MARPCHHLHDERPAKCPHCWFWCHSPKHRRRWGGRPAEATKAPWPFLKPSPPAVVPPCAHLGDALPLQPGTPCGQRVRDCAVHGTCTLRPCDRAKHHCLDAAGQPACPDYDADG